MVNKGGERLCVHERDYFHVRKKVIVPVLLLVVIVAFFIWFLSITNFINDVLLDVVNDGGLRVYLAVTTISTLIFLVVLIFLSLGDDL